MGRTGTPSTRYVSRWNTFEELREVALRAGCPEERFDRIVAAVGRDPFAVATELQSDVLNWTSPTDAL
jgi:hypothetical protein